MTVTRTNLTYNFQNRQFPYFHLQVRENGTDVLFSDCSDVFENTCLTVDDFPANETWDCKDIDNYECSKLDQLFEVDKQEGKPLGNWLN